MKTRLVFPLAARRAAQTGGSTIRVDKRTYENPGPDVPITTLDFE